MKFQTLTDDEIAAAGLVPEGVADFEITEAVEKTSKSGNDMIYLKLNVYRSDGSAAQLRDWILPKMPKKFKHIHDACGLVDKYNAGTVEASDFVGKTGKCIIKHKKRETEQYGEVTDASIDDYVKRVDGEMARAAKATFPEIDDSIGF